MAGGRWYPTLVPLAGGSVLAVAGLDGTSVLNVVPEIHTDGAGCTSRPPSPHWPMYAHLFLLEDGRNSDSSTFPSSAPAPDELNLQVPASAARSLAPPGWYLLFVTNDAGISSEASWIHLT